MNLEKIRQLPKIELHCHLDGSLSKDIIERELKRSIDMQELQVEPDCRSLAQYLEKFSLPLQALQTEKGLEQSAFQFLKKVSEEQVNYVEVRFAPMLSVHESLNGRQVVEAVLRGLFNGERMYGVHYNVILCLMRNHTEEQNQKVIRLAKTYLGTGVCAIDLAGDEAAYPMSNFLDLFEQAYRMKIPFTIHAGECGNVQNVIDAVACGAKRIGHGIALRGQNQAQELLSSKKIGLEMCPISNLQTKAVEQIKDYPIREFINNGLYVTLNTDNRTVSNTSLTKEMQFVQKHWNLSDDILIQLEKNAIEVCFASEDVKHELWKKL